MFLCRIFWSYSKIFQKYRKYFSECSDSIRVSLNFPRYGFWTMAALQRRASLLSVTLLARWAVNLLKMILSGNCDLLPAGIENNLRTRTNLRKISHLMLDIEITSLEKKEFPSRSQQRVCHLQTPATLWLMLFWIMNFDWATLFKMYNGLPLDLFCPVCLCPRCRECQLAVDYQCNSAILIQACCFNVHFWFPVKFGLCLKWQYVDCFRGI